MNAFLFAAGMSLLLTLGACAEPPVAEPPSQADVVATSSGAPAKQICHRERPTGSEIAVTVCRTADVVAEDARNVDSARREIAHEGAVAAEQHAFTGH